MSMEQKHDTQPQTAYTDLRFVVISRSVLFTTKVKKGKLVSNTPNYLESPSVQLESFKPTVESEHTLTHCCKHYEKQAGHPPSLDSHDVLMRISKRKSESSKAFPSTVKRTMASCTKPMDSATAELWGLDVFGFMTYSMRQRPCRDSCSISHRN